MQPRARDSSGILRLLYAMLRTVGPTVLVIVSPACRQGRMNFVAASDPSAEPELVSFPTDDGGVVFANRYGEGDRGVVLAHGGRFDKESWDRQARILAAPRFRVSAIDFRGYGESRSGKPSRNHDENHFRDALAAVRYLRETGASTVSVIEASFGGGASAQAAVESAPGQIDRLVLLAHSSIKHPEFIKDRKLFITARGL